MHRLPGPPARDNGLSSHEGPALDKSALCVPVLPRSAREAHSAVQTLFERPECNRRRDTPACLFPRGPAAPHRRVVTARPPPARPPGARLRSKEPPLRGGGARGGPGTSWAPAAPSPGVWARLWAPRGSGGGESWAASGPLEAGLIPRGDGPSERGAHTSGAAAARISAGCPASQPLAAHPAAAPPTNPRGSHRQSTCQAQGHREHDFSAPSSCRNLLGLNENQLCSQRNQQNHQASKSPRSPTRGQHS